MEGDPDERDAAAVLLPAGRLEEPVRRDEDGGWVSGGGRQRAPLDANGAVVNWAFEMGGPNALIRQGWKRDSVKAGDTVTFEGSLARDGSNLVNARSVVMTETGRKMFAGSSGGDQVPARQ